MSRFLGAALLAGAALLFPARAADAPRLAFGDFFAAVRPDGAQYSDEVKALEGKRVVIRGFAALEPRLDGGLYLTEFREGKLHPDDEETLPWNAVGVLWRKEIEVPPVPARPTVEGTLRLGNRKLGTEIVPIALEDAVPVVGDTKGE